MIPSPLPARLLVAGEAQRHWDGRAFQGIPSIAVTRGGRLWAAWYGGAENEGLGNHVTLATSGDGGASWIAPVLVVEPPCGGRVFDPALWLDPAGHLWLFWAQSVSHGVGSVYDGTGGVWGIRCRDPEVSCPAWQPPRRLADGVMMNRPTVLRDGTWLLPNALWGHRPGRPPAAVPDHLAAVAWANVTASTDGGATFSHRGGAHLAMPADRDFDEHMVVERRDGSLWMLIRVLSGLAESVSSDGGRTWTPARPSALRVPNARFHLRRLRSGRLLLVANRADDRTFRRPWSGRRDLTAWLSEDDGSTWPWSLLLDAREATSYPDADEDAQGLLWLIWDRERYRAGEILLGCVREADILDGRCRSQGSFLARVIDRSGGVRRV